MKPQLPEFDARLILVILLVSLLSLPLWSQSKDQPSPPLQDQKGFPTPELAAAALIDAADAYDVSRLLEIFGPSGKDFIESSDPVKDKSIAKQFAEKARQKHSITVSNAKATLLVGDEEWPLPVPIVKRKGEWYFDTKAGHDEILFRRVGANELDAIQICRGYVEAQKEYALTAHGDPPLHQYAQKIVSTPGKQDGLFWKNPDGSPGGPIGEGVAQALAEGYSDKASPYHGYYFKILQGQGPNAPFGKIDYIMHGLMLGGFALVAVPAEYRVTGVKTFLVSNWGVVYEKDLGPDSLEIAKEMTVFNPDKTWRRSKELVAAR